MATITLVEGIQITRTVQSAEELLKTCNAFVKNYDLPIMEVEHIRRWNGPVQIDKTYINVKKIVKIEE